jgi:hypothetical protein
MVGDTPAYVGKGFEAGNSLAGYGAPQPGSSLGRWRTFPKRGNGSFAPAPPGERQGGSHPAVLFEYHLDVIGQFFAEDRHKFNANA